MSKAVRIREHLHAEVERLAKEEKRSLTNMVEVLLEQALRLNESPFTVTKTSGVSVSTHPGTFTSADREVKSDFK
jgi:hypothetical protein